MDPTMQSERDNISFNPNTLTDWYNGSSYKTELLVSLPSPNHSMHFIDFIFLKFNNTIREQLI